MLAFRSGFKHKINAISNFYSIGFLIIMEDEN